MLFCYGNFVIPVCHTTVLFCRFRDVVVDIGIDIRWLKRFWSPTHSLLVCGNLLFCIRLIFRLQIHCTIYMQNLWKFLCYSLLMPYRQTESSFFNTVCVCVCLCMHHVCLVNYVIPALPLYSHSRLSWSHFDNDINTYKCVLDAIPNKFHLRLRFSWFRNVHHTPQCSVFRIHLCWAFIHTYLYAYNFTCARHTATDHNNVILITEILLRLRRIRSTHWRASKLYIIAGSERC